MDGAGKSTTMRILTGFIPASSGRAEVAGLDVFEDLLEVRRHIGYMPENTTWKAYGRARWRSKIRIDGSERDDPVSRRDGAIWSMQSPGSGALVRG